MNHRLAKANLENELYAQHLGASPNHLADPVFTALEKSQLEPIGDLVLGYDFRAVLRDIADLAFTKHTPLNGDPRRKMACSSDLSVKMWFWLISDNRSGMIPDEHALQELTKAVCR
jgi:hypothetical protein